MVGAGTNGEWMRCWRSTKGHVDVGDTVVFLAGSAKRDGPWVLRRVLQDHSYPKGIK